MANRKNTYVVTGGGGYPGYRLGLALHKNGGNVILADVRPPQEDFQETDTFRFKKFDIRSPREVEETLKGVDCVYHLASYGMSGRDMLNRKQIEDVNIHGTENVLRACVKHNITRLVYTSTYNVVFGGQTIENGDETLPYFPIEKHPDYYSRTKTIAEKKVLAANNTPISGGHLVTCALRLAGVYGPGELRHLPRIVGYMESGLFRFQYGEGVVDFLHVDNLVQAHVKAGEALLPSNSCIAAGKTYFISDGKPINNFLFFKPLCEGLGYSFPTLKLPFTLIYFIAFMTEIIHSIVAKVYNFQPLLTRAEVFKTGMTHWFSLKQAREDLGYIPTIQNDLDEVVKWFLDRGHGRRKMQSVVKRGYSLKQFLKDMVLALIFAALVMSFLPSVK